MELATKVEQEGKRYPEIFPGGEADFFGELSQGTEQAVKALFEKSMDHEVEEYLGGARWDRIDSRQDYRNGSYRRKLVTSFGSIISLNVPRVRRRQITFSCLKRYARRMNAVDRMIIGMYINGVSVRKVQNVLLPLYGCRVVSPALVSRITTALNECVERFHARQLHDRYEYLVPDAVYLNAKSPVKGKRRCVLVAYGMWEESGKLRRELRDFKIARDGESEVAWDCFLMGLCIRGFKGAAIKLVTTDGNRGVMNAVDRRYPVGKRQRCWAHIMGNLAAKIPKRFQDQCLAQAKAIYRQKSAGLAIRAFRCWSRNWKYVVPKAVAFLEEHLESLLVFYQCPKHLWKKVRTTNPIERIFREVRRRTRPMSCFQNVMSLERIVFALFAKMNQQWR